MKWSGEYRVNSNDVDFNNIVSVSNILRIMQDSANTEMEDDGPSYIELFASGYSFILSRIRMSLYSPIHSHDKLEAETWACDSKGVQFFRCFRIRHEGKIVAEAVSVWALCNIATKKLVRVSDFPTNYCTDDILELDMPARLKIPDDVVMKLVGERTVEYADIDMNGHMNNTRYPDMLTGYLGESMKDKRVISMNISFLSEAPLGEAVKIYSGVGDGVHYVRTVKENGSVNVEAEIITEAIE